MGISLPPKRGDFGTSRWAGSKVKVHQLPDWAEGGMTARGTSRQFAEMHQWAEFRSGFGSPAVRSQPTLRAYANS
jgi:hypothetical protein